ncbi:MAG: hypothetical protein INR71_03870 [Terriglobus roseus]|nr:hypothetical protein [Terriglobus roseus]
MGLGVLLLLGAVFFIFWRRKKAKSEWNEPAPAYSETNRAVYQKTKPVELGGESSTVEAGFSKQPVELG